jgi:hypothetical protein
MKRVCPSSHSSSNAKRACLDAQQELALTMAGQHQRRMGACAWMQKLTWKPRKPPRDSFEIDTRTLRVFLTAIAADPTGSKIGRDEANDAGATILTTFVHFVSDAIDMNDTDKWNAFFESLSDELHILVAPSMGASSFWLNELVSDNALHAVPNLFVPLLRAANPVCFLRHKPGHSNAWAWYCNNDVIDDDGDGSLDVWVHALFDACQNAYLCAQDTTLLDSFTYTDSPEEAAELAKAAEWTCLSDAISHSNLAAARCCLFWAAGRVACLSDAAEHASYAEARYKELEMKKKTAAVAHINAREDLPIDNAKHILELVRLHASCSLQVLDQVERAVCEHLIPPLARMVRAYLGR